jgi:hypothetical protein
LLSNGWPDILRKVREQVMDAGFRFTIQKEAIVFTDEATGKPKRPLRKLLLGL